MASKSCKHFPDEFCYVYGQFIKPSAKNVLCGNICCVKPTTHISTCLSGIKTNPGHLILQTPHFTREHCKKTLEGWYRGEKRAMKFAIPTICVNPLTLQAIATSAWRTLPNVRLARMYLLSCI
ncbi:uncharacterized protein LOC143247231 [Tachypleus tridentatus]|uniref:uncharacterized protein LOC143247231 n=1 Tax=Tachypleus tridentatus TaxID=6853 RepID=UPI003FD07EAB